METLYIVGSWAVFVAILALAGLVLPPRKIATYTE